MAEPINDAALDQLFRTARTHNKWQDRPVSDATLRELYDLLKMGPTSANASPARFIFVRSAEGKEKLRGVVSAELRSHLLETVDTLSPDQRAVITLRDLVGMSAAEACDLLELSEGNQRVLLHRARSRVRTALTPLMEVSR